MHVARFLKELAILRDVEKSGWEVSAKESSPSRMARSAVAEQK